MFDIKRTSREALDHARRSLYKPDSEGCGQPHEQAMEVVENANCDMVQEQVKKCQVGNLNNPLMKNGFTHRYYMYLGESTFIFRGIRSDFEFLFHFFKFLFHFRRNLSKQT